jgi:signal transduction histidine kinase
LLEVQEAERKALALDIHDNVGAAIAALRYRLERRLPDAAPEEAPALQTDIALARAVCDEIRRIQVALRPCMLDDIGIGATLRWFGQHFDQSHPELRVGMTIAASESGIPEELKIVLFRVAQEAMANAARHSGGTRVDVRLERVPAGLRLSVADDGGGMNPAEGEGATGSGVGLGSMRERVEWSGGRLTLRSTAKAGVVVIAEWPLESTGAG